MTLFKNIEFANILKSISKKDFSYHLKTIFLDPNNKILKCVLKYLLFLEIKIDDW